jgi:molybdenum cofactor cytidylyltransferase
VETVVLVTGADADRVAAQAQGLDRLMLVHAEDHAEGMAASLRAGIAALPEDAAGVLIFLGDMPEIPSEIAPRLIAALRTGAKAAVPVFDGRRGHPVAFARTLFPELLALRGDRGARVLLAGLGDRLVEVAASGPGVLVDVDTPEALNTIVGARNPRPPTGSE